MSTRQFRQIGRAQRRGVQAQDAHTALPRHRHLRRHGLAGRHGSAQRVGNLREAHDLPDGTLDGRGVQVARNLYDDARAMLLVSRDGPGVSNCLEGLFSRGLTFDDISIKEPNLEDLFLKLTGRELRN